MYSSFYTYLCYTQYLSTTRASRIDETFNVIKTYLFRVLYTEHHLKIRVLLLFWRWQI